MFTTLDGSISYYVWYFPPESYDCTLGLTGLMGSIIEVVVSQHTIESQMLVDARTVMSPRQSDIVALFSASYPAILAGPKEGRDSIQSQTFVDFWAMKTFEEWDK